jgi:hypothetical protein
MRVLRKVFIALLLASYWAATVVPCEPAAPAEGVAEAGAQAASTGPHEHPTGGGPSHVEQSADAGHHGRELATSSSAEPDMPCHSPPALQPRCSCGCDESDKATTSNARLGFALPSRKSTTRPFASLRPETPLLVSRHPRPIGHREPVPT